MNEHYFAVLGEYQRLPGGEKTARKRNKIAKKIDPTAGYVYYFDSPTGKYRGWGYVQNRGEPFNSQIAREIQEAW